MGVRGRSGEVRAPGPCRAYLIVHDSPARRRTQPAGHGSLPLGVAAVAKQVLQGQRRRRESGCCVWMRVCARAGRASSTGRHQRRADAAGDMPSPPSELALGSAV